jgi:hypothetical protein
MLRASTHYNTDNVNPGFYGDFNYNRSYTFFEWMVEKIHTQEQYSTVGMIMLVNEPERLSDTQYQNVQSNTQSLRNVSGLAMLASHLNTDHHP